jgi:MinD superfamily P-loop ATPase
MMVAITGGKGGTGKSTLSANLFFYFMENYSTALVDCDVETPNLEYLVSEDLKLAKEVFIEIPDIREGVSYNYNNVCKEGALLKINDKLIFIEELCSGCKACGINSNITFKKKSIGKIYEKKFNGSYLIVGKSNIGITKTSKIVTETKKYALSKNCEINIIDTAAGTHCNIIRALINSDKVLVVTEPTPFGISDAKRIIKIIEKLKIPYKVVLNRFGISNLNVEYDFKIPYDKRVVETYCKGESFLKYDDLRKNIEEIGNWIIWG